MSFPLTVGDHTLATPAALAQLVHADAVGASGTVVRGQRPYQWVFGLVERGSLERRLAIGLTAALIHHPTPETVCEGARLAGTLAERLLAPVIVNALDAHDVGLLLAADPAHPEASVEDALLHAAVLVCDLADPTVRRPLLERIRHAGLVDIEIPALFDHGDVLDFDTWLPAILADEVSDEVVAAIARRRARGDPCADAIDRALPGAPAVAARVRAISAGT